MFIELCSFYGTLELCIVYISGEINYGKTFNLGLCVRVMILNFILINKIISMKRVLLAISLVLIITTSCSDDDMNTPLVDVDEVSMLEATGDYVAPIGIPNAWISPDIESPERPSEWETELTGYYFVEYSVGSDTDNTYGTPSMPHKTIPFPVPAGSYVVVKGNYNYVQNDIKLRGEGTGEAWVAGVSGPTWIVGDTDDRAEITGNKLLVSGSYVYLENFYFHSSGRVQLGSYVAGSPVDHILIRNNF